MKKYKGSMSVNVTRLAAFVSRQAENSGVLLQRLGHRGLSLKDCMSSERPSGPEERHMHNHKPFLVNAPRKGAQGLIIPCWLEQIDHFPGSVELSRAFAWWGWGGGCWGSV